MSLTLVDFFCGAGGSSQGATAGARGDGPVGRQPLGLGDRVSCGELPHADHFQGDIHAADVARMPAGSLFWASPECPQWSAAWGRRRDFDKQPDLFGEALPDPAADRSLALMWDVPRYLEAMVGRRRPVLAGVVEKVIEVRQWVCWSDWVASIRRLCYRTRLIALNSMHAQPGLSLAAPQSRDRLYLAYWAESLGRNPDWDRWLRPDARCSVCGETVRGVQAWKRPGADMGRYRRLYVYRCPHFQCRHAVL